MSEVIYAERNYEKIINLLERCLAPGGEALMATKVFYFGVGGGLWDFAELVE